MKIVSIFFYIKNVMIVSYITCDILCSFVDIKGFVSYNNLVNAVN